MTNDKREWRKAWAVYSNYPERVEFVEASALTELGLTNEKPE